MTLLRLNIRNNVGIMNDEMIAAKAYADMIYPYMYVSRFLSLNSASNNEASIKYQNAIVIVFAMSDTSMLIRIFKYSILIIFQFK